MRTAVANALQRASEITQLVLITHRAEEVLPLFTHMAYLHGGSIAVQGEAASVLGVVSGLEHRASVGHSDVTVANTTVDSDTTPDGSTVAVFKRQYAAQVAQLAAGPDGCLDGTAQLDACAMASVRPSVASPRGNPEAPSIIAVDNATITYEGRDILQCVSCRVEPGQHWAVTGPNGSGKSTLVRLVYADHPQLYSNDVSVLGRRRGSPGVSIWDLRQDVGIVTPYLHMEYSDKPLSAFAVVCSGFFDSIGLWQKPTPEQVAVAVKWAMWLGIVPLMDRPFMGLSQGEQRLSLLARAMVKSPKVLLLVEPTHGLDAANREHFLGWVDAIGRAGGCTVVYVTHHADEVAPCITHELRLTHDGRVERCGKV